MASGAERLATLRNAYLKVVRDGQAKRGIRRDRRVKQPGAQLSLLLARGRRRPAPRRVCEGVPLHQALHGQILVLHLDLLHRGEHDAELPQEAWAPSQGQS